MLPDITIALLLAAGPADAVDPPMARQDCSAGRIQGQAPYAHDESLPFDFAQPAGWVAQSSESSQRYVTISKPRQGVPLDAVAVSIDVVVSLQPDRYPDMTEDVWRQTMDVVARVPYGRETLVIYSQSWATTAKFLVPHGGRKYQVIVNVNNSEYCRGEAEALRDLVIHSLAPNRDTTFPG